MTRHGRSTQGTGAEATLSGGPVLELRDLVVRFRSDGSVVHAVNGVSFDILPGEVLCVVGESGSGKSVTAMSLMRLLPSPPAEVTGHVRFLGRDIGGLGDDAMMKIRGNDISMIFQDPASALNPVLTVRRQLDEVLKRHTDLDRAARERRCVELLEMVEIPAARSRLRDYPHQFSGGMRQRIMIAMALACRPRLLIADEPTTALDVTTQAQILGLLHSLCQEFTMSVLLITHDVGVVARVADRVVVMYAGTVVEVGDVFSILESPQHPYTEALVRSVPRVDRGPEHELETIPGRPPDMRRPIENCPFYPRCSYRADARCRTETPPLIEVAPHHFAATFYRTHERRD